MPFRITPDPRLVYPGDNIQSALSSLERALSAHRPVSIVSGPSGVGKTLVLSLLQSLIEQHWHRVRVQRLGCGPDMSANELLRLASAPPRRRPSVGGGGNAPKRILLVDEAHNLAVPELDSLLNQSAEQKLLMVLAGPPVLEQRVARLLDSGVLAGPVPGARLQALRPEEVALYVAARLRAAGFRRCPFDALAITAIARYSAGVPRLINQLCATASFNAALAGERRIRIHHVDAARQDLALSLPVAACPAPDEVDAPDIRTRRKPESVRHRFSARRLALVLCAVGVALVVYQPNPSRPAVQPGAPDTGAPAVESASPARASVAALEVSDELSSTPPPAAVAFPPMPLPVAASKPAAGQAIPTPASSSARPRVFIHYTRTRPQDLARAQRLGQMLAASSFELVEIRPVPHRVGLGSVRYFFAQDQKAGLQLLEEIRRHNPGAESPSRVVNFSHYRPLPRPGTLEIWLPNA